MQFMIYSWIFLLYEMIYEFINQQKNKTLDYSHKNSSNLQVSLMHAQAYIRKSNMLYPYYIDIMCMF